ncbi:hypothetical protein INT43_000099 [Umbelopsis isabellina]|uniref:mannosyl-glycoprotein endo-beta-N-acetylglucosaminidase n=1 Tax=Mortierella isabellina TaxID=91625 RepID=A0A8H7PF18_MORIS|nr:hypothetical protein INT43_000099 [Umbelopsis isabellina]
MPSPQERSLPDAKTPKSRPIESLRDVDNWKPTSADMWNISTVPYNGDSKTADPTRRKLLLCHDMANGYKEDENVQGNNHETIWSCQTWQFVDIFVYFTHHRISIPPVNFTNACHRNGVLSLGTFIVEWVEGIPELENFLLGPSSYTVEGDSPEEDLWSPHYADILVDLADQYKFDGWLINIESPFAVSPLSPVYKVKQMVKLLKYLTDKIHSRIPHSKIIWYDSMTKDGDIKWQNTLNDMNQDFFNVVDGLFVNYFWKVDTPPSAYEYAKNMGRPGSDVFLGNDVWGRGSFASGFETWKGLEQASKAKLSSAIFGPAWTYEFLGQDGFNIHDALLWYGGMPAQYPVLGQDELISVQAGPTTAEVLESRRFGISDVWTARPASNSSSFVTCFDRGYGHIFNICGEVRGTSLDIYLNEVLENDAHDWSTEMIPLYSLDMPLTKCCRISYAVKDIQKDINLGMYVRISRPEGSTAEQAGTSDGQNASDCYIIIENEHNNGSVESEVFINPSICQTETLHRWINRTRTYKFGNTDDTWRVIEVGVVALKPRWMRLSTRLLGRIGMISIQSAPMSVPRFEFPQIYLNDKTVKQINQPKSASYTRDLFCTLTWDIKFVGGQLLHKATSRKITDHVYFFAVYYRVVHQEVCAHVMGGTKWIFLGTAFAHAYRVSGIKLGERPITLEFEVRAFDHFGKQLAKPACLNITL